MTIVRSPSPRRPPTQSDVARRASVSQATVSYVLSGDPRVSVPAETRDRVLAAVAELGYTPNSAARALRTRKTLTIAVIIPDITNPFYPALVRGIQDVAEAHRYDVITYNTDGLEERERKAISSASRSRVDGVIITQFHENTADLVALRASGVAVLLFGAVTPEAAAAGVDGIAVDNVGASRTAVDYLIGLGHTRIGMVAGQHGTPPRELRVSGYREALAAHHLAQDPILIRAGDFTEAGGYEAMRELLRVSPRPTAVFAANDLMAIGALVALREDGVAVPQEMAVVGFDDIPAARLVTPPLSTIAQRPEILGTVAATTLMERIAGDAPETGRSVSWTLDLVRRSSA